MINPPDGVAGRPRYLPVAALLCAGLLFAALGAWQVHRLAWKEALIARVTANTRAAPVPLAALSGDAASLEYRRVRFFNELYRITVPGGKCTLALPHWSSQRYYGDPTHAEPFSEFGFYYLDKNWRATNAPHTDIAHNPNGYTCHWNCTWGYAMHQSLLVRNQEYQNFAMTFFKEACTDLVVTMVATKE